MIEDIFSNELLDEPDDIERIIEDEEDKGAKSEKESGDEEETKKEDDKEKPKIRRKFGPRLVLNVDRLKGPRGISTMEEFFSDIKLEGKRKEKEDLEIVMKRLELWTHRLYPRGHFDDCLKKIEKLGSKKQITSYVSRIRLGTEDGSGESDVIRGDVPDSPPPSPNREDPFDQLLSSSTVPVQSANTDMTSEQRERMLHNRLIAEERRAARIKKAQELKEMFRAQTGLISVNRDISESSTSQVNPQENQQDLLMEVDENTDAVRVDENKTNGDLESNQTVEVVSNELHHNNEENTSDFHTKGNGELSANTHNMNENNCLVSETDTNKIDIFMEENQYSELTHELSEGNKNPNEFKVSQTQSNVIKGVELDENMETNCNKSYTEFECTSKTEIESVVISKENITEDENKQPEFNNKYNKNEEHNGEKEEEGKIDVDDTRNLSI